MNSLIKSRWTFAKALLAVSAVFLLVPSAIGRNGGRLSAQEGLPGAESRPAMLRRELRKHIEKMDKLSEKLEAPDFPKGKDWFNSPPLSLKRELRGKIVILDFWTYCCINCIHVLPDLAWLEHRFAGYPVAFVGVHSAKFDNEKVSENIRQAVLRYEIAHPVVNDDEMKMWRSVGVRSWPSLAMVGPRGNLLLMVSGEGNRDVIEAAIAASLEFYPADAFRHDPLPVRLESEKNLSKSPLRFPGKLAIDTPGQRLFISDSNNHRIVVTDLQGRFIEAIGSGRIGLRDGGYDAARFNRLQGLAVDGDLLYVADSENHALRVVDLKSKTVSTLAGDGVQGRDYTGGGKGPQQRLSTPWDVAVDSEKVYIAMAGTHQIWTYDKKKGIFNNFSGTGREQNSNSPDRLLAAWAQPSGLSIGNGKLFIADSESSTVRTIDLKSGATATLVGGEDAEPRNLFAFGDVDGIGEKARLQHDLGVLWLEASARVAVADTYNHRLKLLDPEKKEVVRWIGSGKPGLRDGKGLGAQFSEPSGFALTPGGGRIYIADTNNHQIRIADLKTLEVTTLKLQGVPKALSPVAPRNARLADLPGTVEVKSGELKIRPGGSGKLMLKLTLPAKHYYSKSAPSRWQVLTTDSSPVLLNEASAQGELGAGGLIEIPVEGVVSEARGELVVEALAYYCDEAGACKVAGVVFKVPVSVGSGGAAEVTLEHTFGRKTPDFGAAFKPAEK
ncbi:MAG: thioredoxin-like domain-containing protein [Planctomycetota bacterium]|nr:thioredoxin-like domain-containing protein [Planctomycetota bacterium]